MQAYLSKIVKRPISHIRAIIIQAFSNSSTLNR